VAPLTSERATSRAHYNGGFAGTCGGGHTVTRPCAPRDRTGRVEPAPDRRARVRAGDHVLAEPGDRGLTMAAAQSGAAQPNPGRPPSGAPRRHDPAPLDRASSGSLRLGVCLHHLTGRPGLTARPVRPCPRSDRAITKLHLRADTTSPPDGRDGDRCVQDSARFSAAGFSARWNRPPAISFGALARLDMTGGCRCPGLARTARRRFVLRRGETRTSTSSWLRLLMEQAGSDLVLECPCGLQAR
jgi:hypothetical protein